MKTSLCILFFLFIICGCSKPNKIINYNSKYINEIDSLSNISKELKNKYSFEYITIREFDSDIGIRVSVKDSIFSDCKYFEINILNPIKSDFDSLSVLKILIKIVYFSAKLLIEILRIYIKNQGKCNLFERKGNFLLHCENAQQ
ncbi:MAG: hypothetical protein IPQ19_04610 [Bacteroidetes bacterium]|nr:hypothetical protein [Bacteroidota bacterium]